MSQQTKTKTPTPLPPPEPDVLAAVHARPYYRSFEMGTMHPVDAVDQYHQMTDLIYTMLELLRDAARKFTESGEEDDDGYAWFERSLSMDQYEGIPRDYRGIPAPSAIMLGMLDNLQNISDDLVRCIKHHDEWDHKDIGRVYRRVQWRVEQLALQGRLSNEDLALYGDLVGRISQAWQDCEAAGGDR